MTERLAAEMFPPGDFIEEELEARGWSKGDLADIMGRPAQLVSAIVSGTRKITLETAEDLSAAFGTSAEFWINLDTAYRLWKARADNPESKEREEVRRRARIFAIAPVSDLIRRQWISDVRGSVQSLEREVVNFLEIKSLDDEPQARFAARKSMEDTNHAHIAWFKRARSLATAVEAARYRADNLGKVIEQLRALAKNAEDVRHVPRVLAEGGVRFLVVEHLPKTKIDGAAFWLSKDEPVVVLSMRFGRIDYFWHTLGHELGHIDAGDEQSLDNELVGESRGKDGDIAEQEHSADRFACAMLVPQDRLERFILRKGKYFSKTDIIGFANVIGVHPGIVVGQLQHRDAIKYSHSREMLVNVRELITESALTDGWGKVPPV